MPFWLTDDGTFDDAPDPEPFSYETETEDEDADEQGNTGPGEPV